MIKKITILFILGLMIIPLNSFSQRRRLYQEPEHEMILGLGTNKFFGDIGGYAFEKSFFYNVLPSVSIGYKYTIPSEVTFGIGIDHNNFSSSEKDSHNNFRPLSFKSSVWGVNGQVEYIVFGGPYNYRDTKHTVSIFAGAGVAFANAKVDGIDELKVIHGYPPEFDLDYQFKSSVTAPTAHAGVSYKYRFDYNWSVGIKYRITQYFSDYIDGFHPIKSRRDDAFQDIRISLGYYINSHSVTRNGFRRY